ncbi:MAG: site-specific integrase [Prevotella sp.]|nr:site-specific integrase [Prevotella sp.]
MTSTRYYLDRRHKEANRPQPLKLCITKKGASAYIPVDIVLLPSQWDSIRQRVIDHPNRRGINAYLESRKATIDGLIMQMTIEGKLAGKTAVQIKDIVLERLDPEADTANLFAVRFKAYGESREAKRTRELYAATLKKMQEFDGKLGTLSFDMITKAWLDRFNEHLIRQGLSKNSRNIHFRNIRTVFNDAIDNEITAHYPLRKFDMSPEQTVKRSLSVERLRELLTYPVEPWQQRYVDYFKLTFLLIGINPVDLLTCEPDAYREGRLVYQRAKTGRWYNLKVEPEAAELLEQYRGEQMLVGFSEGRTSYRNFTGKCDKGLKAIGKTEQVANPAWKPGSQKHRYHVRRVPAFPGLSVYWARHTWATIAYSLDIPDETIAAALGHGHGNRTTAIYIDKSIARVDEANRRVIDWVLYGKR